MTETHPFGFSDEARRMSDTIRQAITDGHAGKWIAFALEDCTTDGMVYDVRRDAIRFHANKARMYMYISVPWDDCTPRAAEVYIRLHRQLAKLGQHPADDEMPDTEWMFDTRREAYKTTRALDARSILKRPDPHTPGGLYLPRGYRP